MNSSLTDEQKIAAFDILTHKDLRAILEPACKYGDESDERLVDFCIAAGLPLFGNSCGRNIPLCRAAKFGHLEIVKKLLKGGANAKCESSLALEHAAANGFLEIVRELLKYGASPYDGRCKALHWAKENNHKEVVELLEKCPKPEGYDNRLPPPYLNVASSSAMICMNEFEFD